MFIGTQYYRPPHPPRAEWEKDLQNIVDAGISLVRIWVYWSQVQPRPDRWAWDDVDAFFEAAERHGLKVLVQLMPDAMPYWFSDQHPEALFRDRNGDLVRPTAGGAMGVGGAPGPDYDHPAAQAAGGEFIRRTVQRYTGHPALYAWDVWNELWPFVISHNSVFHGEATLEKWRHWLQAHYGDIAALNRHWMRSYASFDEVEWPVNGIYSDLGTRFLFDQERVADWMRWRVDLVRQHDVQHKVVSHTGGIGPVAALNDPFGGDPTDSWLVTEELDAWGTSCYLPDFYQWSFLLDSTRSSGMGRPYWVSEMNGGRGHFRHPGQPGPGFYSNYLRSAEEIRSQVLLTFSHGGEGVVFWQWRPEHFGPESPGWGLVTANGDPTDRTEVLRSLNATLRSRRELFDRLTFPPAQVAIIWEPRSYQAERLAGWRPDFGYLGGFELFGYHKALTALGLGVEYLNARNIVAEDVPAHVRLLFHPYPVADRPGLTEALSAWVAKGGLLVTGPGVGLFDFRLNGSPRIPPDAWRKLLGVRQREQVVRNAPPVTLRQETIALLIPDILNPYFTEIARGVQDEASASHYLPLLLDTAEDPGREAAFLRTLTGHAVRGIIACGSRLPIEELVAIRKHMDTPMVVINHCVPSPDVGCIMVDLETGIYRATRHLLDLNHTRIAFLAGPATSETSQRRRRGLEAALHEAGLYLKPEWRPAGFPDVDGGFQAMISLLNLPPMLRPTAVITHNDLMALGVLHAIRTHHLRVPEDISVIGIDNIHMAAHANPPLTTLSPPKHRMGRMAMQMLKRLIDGKSAPDPGYTLVECPFIVRESTGPAPGGNGRYTGERSGESV